jgi:hypothetical protein
MTAPRGCMLNVMDGKKLFLIGLSDEKSDPVPCDREI